MAELFAAVDGIISQLPVVVDALASGKPKSLYPIDKAPDDKISFHVIRAFIMPSATFVTPMSTTAFNAACARQKLDVSRLSRTDEHPGRSGLLPCLPVPPQYE
jgi:hypothetical protein